MTSTDHGLEEQPVPHVLSRAWSRQDEVALEHFTLQAAPGHLLFAGQVAAAPRGVPCLLTYGLVCDPEWVTQQAHVHMMLGGVSSMTALVRDSTGGWQVDGVDREDLRGVIDLDIQWTPATNALPINRLKLDVGESRDVDAAWVRIPELTVERLAQRYTRIGERIYRYESGGGSFVAELSVDERGFVERYGGVWVCVGRS